MSPRPASASSKSVRSPSADRPSRSQSAIAQTTGCGENSSRTRESRRNEPMIKTRFISHGTLGSKDLDATRQFYEQFLGLEVVRTSPVSLMIRRGGQHVYSVVLTKNKERMPRCYHNGLDVESDAKVDAAWRVCTEQAAKWGLHEITKPLERHGTYSFLFWDADDNAWEVLSNPKGGYTWIFEQGDLEGRGHFAKGFRDKLPKTEKA